MYRFLFIIIFILLFSCSSEKPGEFNSQKPSQSEGPPATKFYSLQITPQDPIRNSTLYLIPGGFNLSDAKIEWFVNGILTTSALPDQFKTTEINKDNTVQVKTTIQGKEILSNSVKIKNAPPDISGIKFLPPVFAPGGAILSVEVTGKDIDEDTVTFTYEWTKNGRFAGNENRIDEPLHRGDKFSLKVVPFDGEEYGKPAVLSREVANMSPKIKEIKKIGFDGKVLTYQVIAVDIDDDPLTYSLKTAPSGMSIDPATGLIKWDASSDFKGKTLFTVSVTDGHGGEASQSFNLEIKSEQKGPSR